MVNNAEGATPPIPKTKGEMKIVIIKLKWHKDNDKHYTGFEDGGAWGWVYLGLDDTWWWETDCTEDGVTQYTSGFATAEDAKSAADAAYGK